MKSKRKLKKGDFKSIRKIHFAPFPSDDCKILCGVSHNVIWTSTLKYVTCTACKKTKYVLHKEIQFQRERIALLEKLGEHIYNCSGVNDSIHKQWRKTVPRE